VPYVVGVGPAQAWKCDSLLVLDLLAASAVEWGATRHTVPDVLVAAVQSGTRGGASCLVLDLLAASAVEWGATRHTVPDVLVAAMQLKVRKMLHA